MEYVFFRRLPGEGALNHKRRVLEKEGAFTGVCVRSRRTFRRKVHSMASQEENLFPWGEQGLDVGSKLAFDQG